MRRLLFIMIAYFLLIQKGIASDLGIYARVWDIKEIDLKQLIAEGLHKIDVKKIQINYKQQAEHLGENLTPNLLSNADQNKTIYVDPSISLSKNIIINGKVIYKKGTFVNPLTVVRPTENMLFFNGENQDQMDFALQAMKAEPYRLMLVMTKGNPIQLANKIRRPIYYATQGIISRFHITRVPTLLGVGLNQHQNELAITMFATPYSVDMLKKCWSGCVNKKED